MHFQFHPRTVFPHLTQHIRHGRILATLLHRTLVMEPVLSLCIVPGIPGPWHLDAENSFWRTHEEEQGLYVRQRGLCGALFDCGPLGKERHGDIIEQDEECPKARAGCCPLAGAHWYGYHEIPNYSITQGSVLLVLEEFYEPNGSNALYRPNGQFHADTHEQVPSLPHQSHNVNIALAASYDMHHLSSMLKTIYWLQCYFRHYWVLAAT